MTRRNEAVRIHSSRASNRPNCRDTHRNLARRLERKEIESPENSHFSRPIFSKAFGLLIFHIPPKFNVSSHHFSLKFFFIKFPRADSNNCSVLFRTLMS